MVVSQGVSYFLGGLLLTNAIPHWVSGLMGQSFQTPFARPRGQGRSSSTVNVLWGAFNAAAGYLLLFHVGAFEPRQGEHVAMVGLAAVAGSLGLARRFGRFNGGNVPDGPR